MAVLSAQYRMVPMFLVMGIIYVLSDQPGDVVDLGWYVPGLDKLAHLAVYGLLGASVILAHKSSSRKNFPRRVCLTTLIVCLLYGISDEFHQSFVPGRFVSGADLLADVAGAAAVCGGWLWSRRKAVCRLLA